MRYEEQHHHGGSSPFLAFLGGVLVGGIVAVLYAPRSGAETRRRILGAVEETKGLATRVPEAIREASSAAQGAYKASMKESA
jgi:gas vesicle protein